MDVKVVLSEDRPCRINTQRAKKVFRCESEATESQATCVPLWVPHAKGTPTFTKQEGRTAIQREENVNSLRGEV